MSKISHLKLESFTAFAKFDQVLSPGVNVIIGANGTGKTHLLKVLYAATAITAGEDREKGFARKILGVFNPHQGRMTRLIRRQKGLVGAEITVTRDDGAKLKAVIDSQKADVKDVRVMGEAKWHGTGIESAYIPSAEMLAHAPGFLSTAAKREIAFKEVYVDIIKKAFLPKLLEPHDAKRKRLLETLQKAIEGKVIAKGEHFFLKNSQGELEFTLLAEGVRKLALIWLLIQNGTLSSGSMLFWDEPEANLNPALMGVVVEVILDLQRMGVQVFLTTHNYVLLKEFDLRQKEVDVIRYLSLYHDGQKAVVANASDRELMRSLGGLEQLR
jgi:ABC-type ATPase involved in cell division